MMCHWAVYSIHHQLAQCLFNVRPSSATLVQHWNNVVSGSDVCWSTVVCTACRRRYTQSIEPVFTRRWCECKILPCNIRIRVRDKSTRAKPRLKSDLRLLLIYKWEVITLVMQTPDDPYGLSSTSIIWSAVMWEFNFWIERRPQTNYLVTRISRYVNLFNFKPVGVVSRGTSSG